jgi:hypothetical protein
LASGEIPEEPSRQVSEISLGKVQRSRPRLENKTSRPMGPADGHRGNMKWFGSSSCESGLGELAIHELKVLCGSKPGAALLI